MTDDLLARVTHDAIEPALNMLPAMDSDAARVLLLAIGLQESGLCERCQIVNGGGKGPARGLWQFERGGGVLGVLQHPATRKYATRVCDARGVNPDSSAVWARLETDDILAAVFARLLLFSDPMPLPAATDVQGSWRLYALRTWRPGKPHPDRWVKNHERALAFVKGRS